jgi:hypothetical protein
MVSSYDKVNQLDLALTTPVPACGSIKPNVNFHLQMDANSNNDFNYQVGLSRYSSSASYDQTRLQGTGTNKNATFYLDTSCALWTTTGNYSSTEQGYIDTSSAGDPQWYFTTPSKLSATKNYAVPTCFVDGSGYFTCTRPPPAGTNSGYTLFYACPNFWRLGFEVPSKSSTGSSCFQINMLALPL